MYSKLTFEQRDDAATDSPDRQTETDEGSIERKESIMATKKATLAPLDVKALDRAKIRKWLGEGDGHTIFSEAYYTEMGLPEEYLERFTKTYESGGTPKGSIFSRQGEVMRMVCGIYNLTMLRAFAGEIGADTKRAEPALARPHAAQVPDGDGGRLR